ncbi:hypothetical protein NIES4074_65950 [Cylindrospermum sp. NIES-4074]|nr:hypothetical protein NIES4074_65950 [Cylindrospermum sp. NIES-4074]
MCYLISFRFVSFFEVINTKATAIDFAVASVWSDQLFFWEQCYPPQQLLVIAGDNLLLAEFLKF